MDRCALHLKTNIVFINGNLTASRYQHEVLDTEVIPLFEKPQRNAVAARWCSSPSCKGHHCISECKQRKCRRFSIQITRYNIFENLWDELNCRVWRTGAISTTLNQLRANILYKWTKYPQNYIQRYVMLSCRSEQCGGTYPLLSLHGHGRSCRIRLKNIVIFTLFVIYSIEFGLF